MNDSITIIRGGTLIDPANNRNEVADLFIKAGKIASTLSEADKAAARIIDATGQIVAPGFVDVHVHFREPGQTHKETIYSGSRAAAAGGFTSVVCMPNTSPACDTVGTLQSIRDIAQRDSVINLYTTGCITVGRKGEALAPMGSLKNAGIVALTDDGGCVQNHELMRRAAEYAKMLELPIMDHCQEATLTQDAVMNEGLLSLKLGLQGWPHAAEDIMVNRNVILAAYTGAHIHMQHMTSAYSVEILRRAKARGISVSGELSPHHMALTEDAVGDYNTNAKMNPPLRTEADRLALIEGLLDGTIDFIATDHAPHSRDEKEHDFIHAPFGIIGLETCLSITLETLYHSGLADLSFIIDRLTRKPAELCKLPAGTLSIGASADVTLFNPNTHWTVTEATSFSESFNTPWAGKTLKGKVTTTLVAGRVVYENGTIQDR